MNSISRNKYIDKSATPLKAYFTLASARERAQTTYAPARVRTHAHSHTRARTHTHTQTYRQTSRCERKRGGEEGSEGRERSECTYRRVVCSVYKESCLFLADGYRRKTICLGDLECFVSPPALCRPPPRYDRHRSAPLAHPSPLHPRRRYLSRRVIHDANKTSFLPIVHRPIRYRGPILQMDTERGIDRSRGRVSHI